MSGDQFAAAGVVPCRLNTAVDSADGQAIWLVEVGDGLIVLPFAVFHDQAGFRPIAVDGQSDAAAALAGIAHQPVKAVLAPTNL